MAEVTELYGKPDNARVCPKASGLASGIDACWIGSIFEFG